MAPNAIFEAAGFLLGLLLGSFLNVCISRLPAGESIATPRSHCPKCLAPIRAYDNIPLLSWILLAAKCRACKEPIPWRYPAVELATGVWFALVSVRLYRAWIAPGYIDTGRSFSTGTFLSLEVLGVAILGFLLIGLIVMDWQTQLLPDAFTLTGIAIGLFLVCTQAIFLGAGEDQITLTTKHSLRMSSPGSMAEQGNVFLTGPEHLIGGRIVAILGAALILLTVRWTYKLLRKREGMGLGDVKLLALIAAFLGFWPAVLALFLGIVSATFYAIILLIRGRAGAASRLPLGSFLSVGGLIAAVFGDRIIDIYRSFL